MTNVERETLEARLAEIDRRRATLEIVLSSLPPGTPHHCEGCEYQREALEDELRGLWSLRVEIAEQLNPIRRA